MFTAKPPKVPMSWKQRDRDALQSIFAPRAFPPIIERKFALPDHCPTYQRKV